MRLASLLQEPGVEEVLSLAGPVGFLALHGGGQDRVTDQIASEAATEPPGLSMRSTIARRELSRRACRIDSTSESDPMTARMGRSSEDASAARK